MRLEPSDLKELQLLKYYRLIRRWACKTYKLKDADLELLIYFYWIGLFTPKDYIKVSFKGKQLISRIYRIMLGNEDLPLSERNIFFKNKTYTDKVYNKAIDDMFKDSNR